MGGQNLLSQFFATGGVGVRLPALAVCTVLAACGGGGGGGSSASQPQDDVSTPAPGLTFSASPASVNAGEATTLTWQSSNADSCQASGGWSGSRGTSGSEAVTNLQSTQSFTLSCSGEGGGVVRDVTVNVVQQGQVTVDLSADRYQVRSGDQVTLTWDSTNATSCEASGDWSGSQSMNGTFTTPALTSNADFRLTCFAQGQSAVAQVGVSVVETRITWRPADLNVDGTPFNDLASFNVYWGSSPGNYTTSVSVGAGVREYNLDLAAGTYYVAVTSTNSLNEESDFSNEIRKELP